MQPCKKSLKLAEQVKQQLLERGIPVVKTVGQTPRKHSGVLSFFDRDFVRPGHFDREYSRSFHRLFHLRLKDDYELLDSVPKEEAE